MLNLKIISAIAAMATGAAVVLVMPGFSPEADASTNGKVVKGDRLDFRPIGTDCSQQAWPYFEKSCLRDHTHAAGQPREVRVVSVDRR
jgi:hypothetical protein